MFRYTVLFVCNVFITSKSAETCDVSIHTHKNYHLLEPRQDCGKVHSESFSHNVVDARIYNGAETEPHQVPWLVHLRVRYAAKKVKDSTFCGGTLINNRYIITAALCIKPNRSPRVSAMLGQGRGNTFFSDDIHQCVCPAKTLEIPVEEIIKHDDFDANYHNNICLMRLSRTVQFNDFVKPICLPLSCYWQKKELECYQMTVAGWGYQHGYNQPNERSPAIVRRFSAEVKSLRDCSEAWANKLEPIKIIESQICAKNQNGTGACPADTGAPLMLETITRRQSTFYLMGIFSEGWRCDKQDSSSPPSVFTKVTSFLRWILDNIRE